MACRRAKVLADRACFLCMFKVHKGPVVEELAAFRPASPRRFSTKVTDRSFSSRFPRHASSYSIGRSVASQDLRGLSDARSESEDQEEESNANIWAGLGHDSSENALIQVTDASAVIDRLVEDRDTGEVAGHSIWSVLRMPADGVVALVDGLHTLTGASWWLTIIGSTLAFRAAVFPFTIASIKKSAQFVSSMSLLPPIRPPKDSNRSWAEQYHIFTQKRLELGVPSPFWATAGFLQAPLFVYWIIGLRGMAMNHHPGFEHGGTLWFVDLTVPVQGALGALFPSLVAFTYFANIQVSFGSIKLRNDITGFLMKIFQWGLEAVTIPLFIMGFYLPQGVFMYWLTNNCFNLAQSIMLKKDGFRGKFGLPLLSELDKSRAQQRSKSTDADNISPELLDADTLLLSATKYVTEDREEEAVRLLESMLSTYPDEADIYNVYGMLYIKKKQWSEALKYYRLAISKAKDDPPHITALMGAGISLYNQGMRQEAINVMRPLHDIKVPEDVVTRQKYLRALVTLSSVLSQEGLKDEALNLLQGAVKWDRSLEVYVKQLKTRS